jgi:hypothetical protein
VNALKEIVKGRSQKFIETGENEGLIKVLREVLVLG